MPSKYVVRDFKENAYYHVLNSGVEQRDIFLDDKDYYFLKTYLFIYLNPLKEVLKKHPDLPGRLYGKNLSNEVDLIAYSFLPNHFHLLLKQKTKDGISKLMKRLSNAYTLYFNQKHKRTGQLMQGRFKAVQISEGKLFTHIVRFIHLCPTLSITNQDLNVYQWSSYFDYLNKEEFLTCAKDGVLSNFNTIKDFQKFHKNKDDYNKSIDKIKHFIIEK